VRQKVEYKRNIKLFGLMYLLPKQRR